MGTKGQSSIEFLVTFLFTVGLLFLSVIFAVNAGLGYMVHQVGFLASRAYLVYDPTSNGRINPDRFRQEVYLPIAEGYGLDRLGLLGDNLEFRLNHVDDQNFEIRHAYAGVVLQFRKVVSPFSLLAGQKEVDFVSESFLGREPTRGICQRRICKHVVNEHVTGRQGGDFCQGSDNVFITLYDNGC